ncbi:hypothetical protein DFH06DRAFT_262934 [Mycena polygramma]|nr:hypothetical protein DFH06DRAFT_262934 [Mycena polygramma]
MTLLPNHQGPYVSSKITLSLSLLPQFVCALEVGVDAGGVHLFAGLLRARPELGEADTISSASLLYLRMRLMRSSLSSGSCAPLPSAAGRLYACPTRPPPTPATWDTSATPSSTSTPGQDEMRRQAPDFRSPFRHTVPRSSAPA